MTKQKNVVFQQGFFLALLILSGLIMWHLFAPFINSLAAAAIITTICYPIYDVILSKITKGRASLAALLALGVVFLIVILPLTILSSFILREAISVYSLFNSTANFQFMDFLEKIQTQIQVFVPEFSLDIGSIVQQTAQFVVDHLVSFFAGTASTLFLFFIVLLGCYYFFKDGKYFTSYLVKLSPLRDTDDSRIISRLALAIRSVAIGTISVAIIQGILTSVGLFIAGFDRAILFGCIAAIGALVPGVGTTIVLIPAIIFLFVTGAHIMAIFLIVWGVLAVGLIDNILGPQLMSRGNKVHPFLLLLSVLGGIALLGPIGFILGPVILNLFLVLIELYYEHMHEKT